MVGTYKGALLVRKREHDWYILESTVGAYGRAWLARIRGFLFRAGGCIGTIVGVLLFPHRPLTKAPLILVAPTGHDLASNPLDYANNVHDKSPGCVVPHSYYGYSFLVRIPNCV